MPIENKLFIGNFFLFIKPFHTCYLRACEFKHFKSLCTVTICFLRTITDTSLVLFSQGWGVWSVEFKVEIQKVKEQIDKRFKAQNDDKLV